MSIADVSRAVGCRVIMKYEDGGKVQVFYVGDEEFRLPGNLSTPQVIEAILSAKDMEQTA